MQVRCLWVLILVLGTTLTVWAGSWPQFRGPNASGIPSSDEPLPTQIGPEQNVRWKVAIPPGHSSPAIHGEHIVLTGVVEGKLLVFCLDRNTGKTLWQDEAPHKGLEKIHQVGSHAQSTSATDGEVVVSFFGSSGLLCHDMTGRRLWHLPLGPFKNDFGAGSSPILVGSRVVLGQDHDTDSFLMAVDKRTGRIEWRVDRSEFPRGYSSPVLWHVGDRKQIVVAGTLRVVGYELETGKEAWTVRGLSRIINMTPVVGGDGILYLGAWAPGADADDRIQVPSFEELAKAQDANKNGMLESDEIPSGPLKDRFTQIDRDKDGHITRAEYEDMRRIFTDAQNVLVAIKPGGQGDVTASHVLWKQSKMLPYVPSPLWYRDQLFMVKNGGLLSSIDPKTGVASKQGRVFGGANYYSSPVAGDGKIYTISQHGELSVISAEPNWRLLSKARFEEDVFATPAIVDGSIYLRTAGHLYRFGR